VESRYDFDGGDDLFDELRVLRFSGLYRKRESPDFSWFGGAGVETAAEPGADLADSIRTSLFGVADLRVSDELSLGLGVSVSSRLEGGVRVVPFPAFDWRISGDWRLRTEPRLDRVRVVLSHDLADDWTVGAEVGWFGREHRLEEDDRIFDETRITAGLSAEWRARPDLTVFAVAGVQLGGELELEDEDGDRLSETDLGSAAFLGLGVQFRF